MIVEIKISVSILLIINPIVFVPKIQEVVISKAVDNFLQFSNANSTNTMTAQQCNVYSVL